MFFFAKVIHSRFQDLIPAQVSKEDDPELMRPDDEEIAEVSDALNNTPSPDKPTSPYIRRVLFPWLNEPCHCVMFASFSILQVTEKTRLALEKEVSSKIAAAQPTHVPQQQGSAQYIRYTPSQQGLAFNSGAKQRVIRMVEAQKDPMEPPRFKYGENYLLLIILTCSWQTINYTVQ